METRVSPPQRPWECSPWAPGLPANHRESGEENRSLRANYTRPCLFQPGSPWQGWVTRSGCPSWCSSWPWCLQCCWGVAARWPSSLPEGVFPPACALKASLEIQHRVLDGAGLHTDFHLASLEGRTLVFEQDNQMEFTGWRLTLGTTFCCHNTLSTVSEKVVFFELTLESRGGQEQDQED